MFALYSLAMLLIFLAAGWIIYEAIEDIMAYNLLRTPGLVIDEHVVASGRIPSAAEIVTMIMNALA